MSIDMKTEVVMIQDVVRKRWSNRVIFCEQKQSYFFAEIYIIGDAIG